MGVLDDKREVFSNIAALRTSCEGFPKFNLNDSFSSVSNCTNSLDFLIDLLKSLVGFDFMKEIVVDTIVFDISDIEQEIKTFLKRELKELVSCGVNPSIPHNILHQNINPLSTGVDLDLRKLDFLGIMLVNPTSDNGSLLYDDASAGLNSTDFNTYLFQTVQQEGTQTNWGSQTLGTPNDILSITFNSVGPPNNRVNVKISEFYSDPINNKKLTDVNNDYIDSINLFGSQQMVNNIIDMIFGSISFDIKKTTKQLETEAEIEEIINCALLAGEGDVFDDSFFTFSNEQISKLKATAKRRKDGYDIVTVCGNIRSEITAERLREINLEFSAATDTASEAKVVSSVLDKLAEESAANSPNEVDKQAIKLNFIENIIKKLMQAITNIILSPKLMMIFAINHMIIYNISFESALDFLRKNNTFLKGITDAVRDTIINKLLGVSLKEIGELVACNAVNVATEYAKNQVSQIASLVGIPQDVLRIIRGLG